MTQKNFTDMQNTQVTQNIRARNWRHKASIEKNHYGYIFMLPFIIVFLTFGLYPVFHTIYLSFTNTTMMSRSSDFVWFHNFRALLSDSYFTKALGNTWLLWSLNFIPQIGIAMLLSVLFTNARLKIKYVGFWRAMFYLPNLLMPATIAVLFFNFFSFYGPVNQVLVRMGIIPEAIDFIRSETAVRGMVIFIQWWMWFGNTIILLMAGMTSISPAFYESAMVDGATTWSMFSKITLPLIKPVMIYILVVSLVGGMQMWDIPFMITDGRGSPNNSVMTMNVLMYMRFSSDRGHIGAAATVGVMIFLITSIVALGIFCVLRNKDDIEDSRQIKRKRKGAWV